MSEQVKYLRASMPYASYYNSESEQIDEFLANEGFDPLMVVHEVYDGHQNHMVFLQEMS